MAAMDEIDVGSLLKQVGADVKTIAGSEMELARAKMGSFLARTMARASLMLLSVFVALVGFAMLCIVAIVVLEPMISALWLRLLVMSAAFVVVGVVIASVVAKRLLSGPDLDHEIAEVGQTADAISKGIGH